jgi:LysM repeat protein
VVKRFRRLSLALFSVIVLLAVAGCGGNGSTLTADETSDPAYQQAQNFKRQDRNSEALAAFLKVIDRRGESGAPESHIEAGLLYRTWAKDPVEAYHHFKKYLELMPNSPKAEMVRQQCDAAKRDIARVLLAPAGDQGVQLQTNEEIDQLRRRVQELEAENQTLHGSGGGVVAASPRSPPLISLSDDRAPATAPEATNDSPLTPAPTSSARASSGSPLFTPPSSPPPASSRTPASRTPAANTAVQRTSATAQRPASTPQRPTSPGGRTHTVAPKETLWNIARRYYGPKPTAAQVHAIETTNGLATGAELRPGMVLKIP